MLLTEVRHALESGPARRALAGGDFWLLETRPWWHLFGDFDGLERTKLAVLMAAWQLPKPLFLVPTEPLEPEFTGFLSRDGTAWRLDKATSAVAFYRTGAASRLGNWQLYAAERPVFVPIPDTFRTPPEKVLAFMAEQHVVLLIDVFHDDTDWRVALLEPDHLHSAG